MTIITQPICEKKISKQKEPLVPEHQSPQSPGHAELADGHNESGSPLMVTMMKARARRVSSLTTVCVFLTAMLVLTTGIIGGIYLYKQFTQYRLRHFRGWCSIPYTEKQSWQSQSLISHGSATAPRSSDQNDLDKMINYFARDWKNIQKDLQSDSSNEKPNNVIRPTYDNFFDEEFDIDIEFEQYERIEIPDFSHGRRGRFIHDFSVNKTGIIDLDEGRCFLMNLNRSLVLPPQSLFDLVVKMRSGYYDVDTEIVRESYRVVTPPVSDMKTVGYYIGRECAQLPTYKLEKITSPVFKRSVDANHKETVFAVFAGKKISEIFIMNLHNAPGNK